LIFCDDADRFWYRTSIKEKKYGVFFTERAGALLLCIKIGGNPCLQKTVHGPKTKKQQSKTLLSEG
jgi:hypothetical protein